ncbi:MAG: hypothetical protein AABY22_35105 [Nanoarchaeota archaeon]
MNEEKIIEILEGLQIPSGKIDEFMSVFKNDIKQSTPVAIKSVEDLKSELLNETDWRKKASIAARIISLNLE